MVCAIDIDLALVAAVLGCELFQFLVCFAQPGLEAFKLIFLTLDSILSVKPPESVHAGPQDGDVILFFDGLFQRANAIELEHFIQRGREVASQRPSHCKHDRNQLDGRDPTTVVCRLTSNPRPW
jgi:hypothetical protein